MKDRQWIFLALALLTGALWAALPTAGKAQVFEIGTTPDSVCNRLFTDNGGIDGFYPPNTNLTTTICSEDPANTHLLIQFLGGIDLGPGDTLYFYDGPSVAAPPLAKLHAGSPRETISVLASVDNTTGCLTAVFRSDAAQQAEGWIGNVFCRPRCQQVVPELLALSPAPVPADTGWVDLCIGEPLTLEAGASFPEDGTLYDQSETGSTFSWNMGDGTQLESKNITYAYRKGGGYFLELTVTDEQGCSSTRVIEQRIRVAPSPDFDLANPLPTFCPGDSIELDASFNQPTGASLLTANPTTSSFPAGGILADSLPLPDIAGFTYETSILIDEFAPNQLLTALDDLEGICINIEHSWMGDLGISITCPDGTNVVLNNFLGDGFGRYLLGEPVLDADEVSGIVPGRGYDYCWTPNAPNGSWKAEFSIPVTGDPVTVPAGNYESEEPLTALIGCPLNGEWTIKVTDQIAKDNGIIFNWGVNFSEDILPNPEQFTPALVNGAWQNDPEHISQFSPQVVTAKPASSGDIYYRFQAEDDFGCTHDTALVLNVLPPLDPACNTCTGNPISLADTTICELDTLRPVAQLANEVPPEVTFATNPQTLLDQPVSDAITPYPSTISVGSMAPAVIADPAASISEVCFNLEADPVGDLLVQLQSPDGQLLTLVDQEGGNGADFVETCFSPTAADPVATGTAPFTGTFLPEEDWSVLTGSAVNGDWSLRITDQGSPEPKVLFDWHITLFSNQSYTYSWSPANGLSCTDCPDPLVAPTGSTSYELTIRDAFGCEIRDTLNVTVEPIVPSPPVNVRQENGQDLTFEWPGLPAGTPFEYRITRNGIPEPWSPPTTQTQLTLPGLAGGTTVRLEVRQAGPGSPLCPPQVNEASATVLPCGLQSNPSVTDITCFGGTGSVTLAPTGNYGSVDFELLPGGLNAPTGQFTGLTEGTYDVNLTDSLGCTATTSFSLSEPPLLEITAQLTRTTTCNDRQDGIANATVSGGEGPPYDILWKPSGETTLLAENLSIGAQTVVVTDQRGCVDSATVLIPGPDPITLKTEVTNPSCFGATDGKITATATKFGEQVFLNWDDGSNGPEITGLGPGIYCVTATDLFGCSITRCDTLTAPAALEIDSLSTRPVSCQGGRDGLAVGLAKGGTKPYNYRWDDPLQQANSIATSLAVGTYTLTVTDDAGCQATATATVTEPPPLQMELLMDPVICRGDSTGQVEALVQGGTGPYRYRWVDGSVGPVVSGLPAGRVALTVTDSNGCTLRGETFVTQPATSLEAEIRQTDMGCLGESGNGAVVRVFNVPDGRGLSFRWSTGAADSVVTGLPAGNLGVTVTDALGCTARDSFVLQDLAPITFSIQANRPTCPGETDGSLGVAIITGGNGQEASDYSFQWSTGDQGPVIRNLAGGQIYSVTVADSTGCTATEERFLAEPRPLSFDLETIDVSCAGETDGSAILSNITSESDVYTVEWEAPVGAVMEDSIVDLPAGTYTLALLDINRCRVDTSFTIAAPPALSLSLSGRDNLCAGDSEGEAAPTVNGGTPGYAFAWSNGAADSVISDLPAGLYTLEVTDSTGCTIRDSILIDEPQPIALAPQVDNPSCNLQNDGSILLSASGGNGPYQYRLDDGVFGTDTLFENLTSGVYQVTVQDSRSCLLQQEVIVSEPQPVIVDLGGQVLTLTPGDTIQIPGRIVTSDGPVQLFWETDDPGTLSCLDCLQPLAFPVFTTTYTLRVIDEAGCEGVARVIVQVNKRNLALVPTGFTPNQDKENDRLLVHGDPGVRVLNFRVFNRWGELVFEGEDFPVNSDEDGWDGNYRQKPAPAGVYLWVLEAEFLDGTTQVLQGQTTLIR